MLCKAQLKQVGEGGERIIYTCDDYPDIVFKWQKPVESRRLRKGDLKSVLLKAVPGFQNYNVALEYKTYLRACLNLPFDLDNLPVARIFGFVPCEDGPLQMCEKISMDGTQIGPTLSVVGRQGVMEDADITALNLFAGRLLQSNMPTHDLSAANIVKGRDGQGGVRFVLIDGLGDVKLIPMRRFSARTRRAHLVRSFQRLEKFGLVFDVQSFDFARAK